MAKCKLGGWINMWTSKWITDKETNWKKKEINV